MNINVVINAGHCHRVSKVFCVVFRALLGVYIVARGFLWSFGWFYGVAMCLGGCQGISSIFWVVARVLLGVWVVARVFLGYSGWLQGHC